MGFCALPIKGDYSGGSNPPLDDNLNLVQLPDPNAKGFTPEILKNAMLSTISTLNDFAESAGISEVRQDKLPLGSH